MGIIKLISDACDNITATVSPSVDALGLNMVLALATIMMVWFGVQEALASAQGGQGFNMGKFLNFVMLITFAYTFTKYFDNAIPGLGWSMKGFVQGGTSNLVQLIGTDSTSNMLQALGTSLASTGPGIATSFAAPYLVFAFLVIQITLAILSACISVIVAYGELGATIIALLGPVFIPWLVFEKTEFLFWGWLKAYLGFEFYKVVAAAVMSVLGHLFMTYSGTLAADFSNPITLMKDLPIILMLVAVCLFLLFKIPHLTATLFSGSTSGHDAGMGLAAMALRAGM